MTLALVLKSCSKNSFLRNFILMIRRLLSLNKEKVHSISSPITFDSSNLRQFSVDCKDLNREKTSGVCLYNSTKYTSFSFKVLRRNIYKQYSHCCLLIQVDNVKFFKRVCKQETEILE